MPTIQVDPETSTMENRNGIPSISAVEIWAGESMAHIGAISVRKKENIRGGFTLHPKELKNLGQALLDLHRDWEARQRTAEPKRELEAEEEMETNSLIP